VFKSLQDRHWAVVTRMNTVLKKFRQQVVLADDGGPRNFILHIVWSVLYLFYSTIEYV
jgi:hypothetical protein